MYQQADHVGLVWRGAVERARAQIASAGFFQHDEALDPAQPQAAVLARHLRQVQALFARDRTQLGKRFIHGLRIMDVLTAFQRDCMPVHESSHAFAQFGAGGIALDIQQIHSRPLSCSRRVSLAMFNWWIWLVPSYRRNRRTSR